MNDNSSSDYILAKEKATEVYKWMKICQAILLVALGIVFIACAYNSTGGFSAALPICLGIVFSVYGLLELLAGYYLYRNVINQEVLFGIIAIAFAVVLFTKNDVLQNMFAVFVGAVVLLYAVMLITFGVDRCVGKDGVKKNIPLAVGSFIGAALLIASGVVYLVFQHDTSKKEEVDRWMIIISGGLMIVIGVAIFVVSLVRVRNTKKAMQIQQAEAETAAARKHEDETSEVKVVDLSDLKKENKKHGGKKIFNHQTTTGFKGDEETPDEDDDTNDDTVNTTTLKAISDSSKDEDDDASTTDKGTKK